MLKRFLRGAMFGAGFAVALLVVLSAGTYFFFPLILKYGISNMSEPEEVRVPPEITRANRFLGTSGMYFGEFDHERNRVLSAGPGQIVGQATVDGEPLEGLRLRLALNGSVMSQWATTGSDGRYEIGVPYGEYRIDGYDLDVETANSVLAGKIEHPQLGFSSGTFDVSAGEPGRGLNLKFVEPVILDMPKNRFSADEDVMIRWKPYPGAKEYLVQLHERTDPDWYGDSKVVFRWPERPVVNEPYIRLGDYDIDLKPGHYYTVDVEARSASSRPISITGHDFSAYDFEVVE